MNRSVSVIVPAYNCADSIGATLDSILTQTAPPEEIIVIDDGSTDGTSEVVVRHPRSAAVHLVRQENGGAAAARNAGIAQARHEWIAFLDGDDRWLPRRLELAHGVLDRHPDLVWVAGAYRDLPRRRPPEVHRLSPAGRVFLREGDCFGNVFAVFDRHCIVSTNTVMLHRRCLAEAGVFDPALKRREDVDLWTRVGLRFPRLGWIDEPVAEYIHRPGSLTESLPELSALEMVGLLRKRLAEFPEAGSLSDAYGRHLATQGCKIWLHSGARSDLRRALQEFPEWLPSRWRPWLRSLAALPAPVFTAQAALLNARLRLLGRDRRSRAARAR